MDELPRITDEKGFVHTLFNNEGVIDVEVKDSPDIQILTPKQELFCQYYIKNKGTRLNGTWAYALAYDYDLDNAPDDDAVMEQLADGSLKEIIPSSFERMESTCAVCASKLLRNTKISERITELWNEMLTDKEVDSRLADIILTGDDKDSMNAIKEYNALKQRVVKKTDITSAGKPIVVDRSSASVIDEILSEYIGITKTNESEKESDQAEEAIEGIEEVHSEEVHHGDLGSPSAEAGAQA